MRRPDRLPMTLKIGVSCNTSATLLREALPQGTCCADRCAREFSECPVENRGTIGILDSVSKFWSFPHGRNCGNASAPSQLARCALQCEQSLRYRRYLCFTSNAIMECNQPDERTNAAQSNWGAQINTHWLQEGLALPKVVSETHC